MKKINWRRVKIVALCAVLGCMIFLCAGHLADRNWGRALMATMWAVAAACDLVRVCRT